MSRYRFDASLSRRPAGVPDICLLRGSQGTGKSAYSQLLTTVFDGRWQSGSGAIDGNKLTNDGALRFVTRKWKVVASSRSKNCRRIENSKRCSDHINSEAISQFRSQRGLPR